MFKKLLGSLALGFSQAAAGATYHTTNCARHGHPEFQINVSSKSIPVSDVDWFLSTIESMVAAGERFKSGETIQIGWTMAKIEQGEKGALRLLEPDMTTIPLKFVDSMDATIRQLRAQKDSVESVLPASSLLFPTLTQSVVVHVDYKQSKRLVLERLSPQGSDSGWWLSDLTDIPGAKDPSRFAKISLYQLAIHRPDLVRFFAFPVGVQVIVDGQISVMKDGSILRTKSGSYLDLLNQRKVAR